MACRSSSYQVVTTRGLEEIIVRSLSNMSDVLGRASLPKPGPGRGPEEGSNVGRAPDTIKSRLWL